METDPDSTERNRLRLNGIRLHLYTHRYEEWLHHTNAGWEWAVFDHSKADLTKLTQIHGTYHLLEDTSKEYKEAKQAVAVAQASGDVNAMKLAQQALQVAECVLVCGFQSSVPALPLAHVCGLQHHVCRGKSEECSDFEQKCGQQCAHHKDDWPFDVNNRDIAGYWKKRQVAHGQVCGECQKPYQLTEHLYVPFELQPSTYACVHCGASKDKFCKETPAPEAPPTADSKIHSPKPSQAAAGEDDEAEGSAGFFDISSFVIKFLKSLSIEITQVLSVRLMLSVSHAVRLRCR